MVKDDEKSNAILKYFGKFSDCGVQRNGDIFFLAAPNGVNDALDVATDIADNFRFKERLRVQYFMDACDSTVDNGFQGPDRHCRRLQDAKFCSIYICFYHAKQHKTVAQ